MSNEDLATVDELLAQWEELRENGIDSNAEELCASVGRTDLVSNLEARILKLEAIEPWGEVFGGDFRREPAEDSAVSDSSDPDLPESIGEFRVLRKLGNGGIGIVYLCEEASPNRLVAIKVLRSSHSPDSERVRRLLQEADILAMLDHPGIARVFSCGEAEIVSARAHGGKITYLCMEYVPGTTPQTYLRDKSTDAAVSLVVEILDAVSHAHQKGVIHRDIKPSNIVVSEQGHPKLLDFGIAKLVDPGYETLTAAYSFLGSLRCVSPEQLSNPRSADSRSDIYSVAAMAYELLTGKSALDLEHHTFQSACKAIECDTPPRMSIHCPELAGDLETIIAKGLSRAPEDRYQSASEFMDDLRRFRRGEVVMAKPVSAGQRIRKWAKRNRLLAAIYTGGIATILIATVASVYWARAASQRAAEVTAAKLLADARLEKMERSNFNMSLFMASGNLPLDPGAAVNLLSNEEQCPPSLRDFTWGLLHQCASNTIVLNQESGQHVNALCFSAGSGKTSLLVGFDDGRLVSRDVDSLETTFETRPVSWPISNISCSNDGEVLAIGAASGEVSLVDPSTGAGQSIDVRQADGGLRCLTHSASLGGFVMAYGDGDVFVSKAPSYVAERKLSTGLPIKLAKFSNDGNVLFISTEDNALAFIDVASGEITHAKDRVPRQVSGIGFLHTGEAVAVGLDGSSYKWDKNTGDIIAPFATFPAMINRFEASPSGVQVAFGFGKMYVFNGEFEGVRYRELRVPWRLRRASIAVSEVGDWIAIGTKRVALWNLNPLVPTEEWQSHGQGVFLEILDESADSFCYVDANEFVVVRNGHTEIRKRFADENGTCSAVGRNRRLVAIGCLDESTYVIDATNGQVVATLPCKGKLATELAFWDEDRKLLVGYDNGEIEFRDLATELVDKVIRVRKRPIRKIRVSSDGTTLVAVGDGRRQIVSYDLLNQTFNWRVDLRGSINDLVLSPDARSFFTCDKGGKIRKWDAFTGGVVSQLVEPGEPKTALALAPDGKALATISVAGPIDLWDATTGTHRLRLDSHRSSGTNIMFAPNGRSIVSAARDSKIFIWRLRNGKGK